MIVVIIAGGAGTRLWPLSTPKFPKHLLKLNDNDPSLLQLTYQRAKHLTDKIYVVSEASHIQHVREQLNALPNEAFIVEPGRRGTANCIIAAIVHISSRQSISEPLVILSADHYIRDLEGFHESIDLAAEASKNESKIILVGVEPDYPATGFGYIQKDNPLENSQFIYKVHSFKEKPTFDLAREYVKSGKYLWNCGYFVASVNTFVKNMKTYAPNLYENYQKLSKTTVQNYVSTYLSFDNITIDYGLIEKVKNLLVVRASFDWMDLGSYSDLYKAVESDKFGNHTKGYKLELEEVANSFIENHEDKPMAIIGLDNVVVINTAHGILITRRDLSQKVGDVSKRITKS